jgi:hypothetical protein
MYQKSDDSEEAVIRLDNKCLTANKLTLKNADITTEVIPIAV